MNPRPAIYLDYNATTPVDERVFEAMRPWFTRTFGNAASNGHAFGHTATGAVARAAEQVAHAIGATEREIIWTSGATESNNLAIKGVIDMYREKGAHVISQPTEHKAVIDTIKRHARAGGEVTWLDVDGNGRIDLDQLRDSIRPDTLLVSIMAANNEIGTTQDIRAIGKICKEKNVLFHTDATQAIGKAPVHVIEDGIDLMSFTAHKIYGPKGCGGLYVRGGKPRVHLTPQMDGGGHQQGMRSGTLNVPGIVGLGAAIELAMSLFNEECARLAALRDRLQRGIMNRIDGVSVNGDEAHRLPHVTNLSFAHVDGEYLIPGLQGIAVSSGSACTSAVKEPSFVLRALGVEDALAYASVRFSLGRYTTEQDIDFAVDAVTRTVSHLRQTTPV